MSEELWNSVDSYICNHLVPTDAMLEHVLASTKSAGIPEIQVAPNQGKMLEILAQTLRAQRILEIGTLAGYSTLWLARGLQPGGSLITLESNPKHAKVAQENFSRAGLNSQIELRLGPAVDSLAKIAAEESGPFDLTFIDADKPSTPEYFRWALKLSRPGSLIICDNVVRDGAIIDPKGDASAQGMRRFYEAVASEPRVTATAIQTVGSKGYDGFAIVLVKGV